MLTESVSCFFCFVFVLFFFFAAPCCFKRHFVRWIFDLGAKEGDKAGSSQPPVHDQVHVKAPSPLVRYVSTPAPSESSSLPKFLKKSDHEVTRPTFSIWSVQNSRPGAFEVCASIQIHQSAYRDRCKNLCGAGLGFELTTATISWLVDLDPPIERSRGIIVGQRNRQKKVWHKAQYFVIGTYEHVCGKHNRENYKNVKNII